MRTPRSSTQAKEVTAAHRRAEHGRAEVATAERDLSPRSSAEPGSDYEDFLNSPRPW